MVGPLHLSWKVAGDDGHDDGGLADALCIAENENGGVCTYHRREIAL